MVSQHGVHDEYSFVLLVFWSIETFVTNFNFTHFFNAQQERRRNDMKD